jgi:ribosomal protein S18 acetylase RimI-like enzyme
LNPPTINIAKPTERDRVIATVVMGFSADPLTRWFWPEARDYLMSAPLFDAFGGKAVESGTAFVSAGFEGAALWLPPGVTPDEERVGETLQKTIAAERLEDVSGVFEKMDEYHPDEDIWYLPLIAVDPCHQGKGIGSTLMKAALQRCDEAGLPAYLESSNPRNISLYERHGFETMGEIQVGGSPIVTPMYRPAR